MRVPHSYGVRVFVRRTVVVHCTRCQGLERAASPPGSPEAALTRPCSTRSGRAPSRPGGAPPARARLAKRRSPSPTPRASRRSRCAASRAELGLGTMSLYHYVRGKDELLDLMSDAILGRPDRRRRRAAEGLARRPARDRVRHARPTSSATRGSSARCARARGRSRAQLAAPLRPVGRRASPTRPRRRRRRWRSSRSSTTTSSASCCARSRRARGARGAGRARAGCRRSSTTWRRSSRPGPTPTSRASRQANRAAGGRDEDLAEMALDQGRFERGLDRLLDGVEVELKRRRGR